MFCNFADVVFAGPNPPFFDHLTLTLYGPTEWSPTLFRPIDRNLVFRQIDPINPEHFFMKNSMLTLLKPETLEIDEFWLYDPQLALSRHHEGPRSSRSCESKALGEPEVPGSTPRPPGPQIDPDKAKKFLILSVNSTVRLLSIGFDR